MISMKLNILLLCNKPPVGGNANTIVDHIEAFEQGSKHHIWLCSGLKQIPSKLAMDKFDAIIIHYSLSLLSSRYLTQQGKKRLRDFSGLKVIFIQDEYRRIHDVVDELAYLKMDVLFTCFPEREFEAIYPQAKLPKLSKYNNLTGYVPARLTAYTHHTPICERSIDVGYRGRKSPYWYGALGYEKWEIAEKWRKHVPEKTLKSNVSCRETDRIYGEAWTQFLSSCKTTLGVESGTSVMDFTGKLEQAVDQHQITHPRDGFDVVQKKYFAEHEGLHQLNQISPRCFEAIALKTVLVLYEGDYSGILTPDRHYIALKKDFSNIQAVIAKIQDDAYLQHMADVAYDEIALNPKYSYQAFVEQVDGIVTHEFIERANVQVAVSYDRALFEKHSQAWSRLMTKAMAIFQGLPFGTRSFIRAMFRPHLLIQVLKKGS